MGLWAEIRKPTEIRQPEPRKPDFGHPEEQLSGLHKCAGLLGQQAKDLSDRLSHVCAYGVIGFQKRLQGIRCFVTQRASWTRSRDDVSGEDQREVRKRLWEVSELALQPRIVLLREKPQVIS